MNPQDFLYTKEHEWIHVKDGIGTVGITQHAQSELGDVVFVDMPKPGATVRAKDTFGSVESVKAVSEVYSPITGEVIEVNATLNDHPEVVNGDPYGEGWMIRIKMANANDLKNLMTAADYEAYVHGLEGH
jgi:glycine cleavage system H protein